jgi:hypothetical protein
MVSFTIKKRSSMSKTVKEEKTNPFIDILPLNKINIAKSNFDWVYTTKNCPIDDFENVWLDIEDLTYYQTAHPEERNKSKLKSEQQKIDTAKLVTFGSKGEYETALQLYKFWGEFEVFYPYIAKRTIPVKYKAKDKEFSLVYAGSVFTGSYRSFYGVFEQILNSSDFPFVCYFLNWNNRYERMRMLELEDKYEDFILRKPVSFSKLKYEISNFAAGLYISLNIYRKPQLTNGMKPFEYAYANVQPVSIGVKLENFGKEFGYESTPTTIKEDYVDNLKNFDFDNNLMDNNLERIYACLEDEL